MEGCRGRLRAEKEVVLVSKSAPSSFAARRSLVIEETR
jgi:hypothetical protein